jgi:hypothetical protein
MCFSAGASFGASAVLSIIGTTAIIKARTVPQGLFAGIPMIFSVQQLSEGFVWLAMKNPDLAGWQPFFTHVFLVFALALWPVWIPFTIRNLEQEKKRRRALTFFLFTGIVVSVAAVCALLLFPVQVMRGDAMIIRAGFPAKRS